MGDEEGGRHQPWRLTILPLDLDKMTCFGPTPRVRGFGVRCIGLEDAHVGVARAQPRHRLARAVRAGVGSGNGALRRVLAPRCAWERALAVLETCSWEDLERRAEHLIFERLRLRRWRLRVLLATTTN